MGLEYYLLALLVFVCHSDHHEHLLPHHVAQQPLDLHARRWKLRIFICHDVGPLCLFRLYRILLLRSVMHHRALRLKEAHLDKSHRNAQDLRRTNALLLRPFRRNIFT